MSSWPIVHGCSLHVYSYEPAFPIVTDADSPGLIEPVLHEPSRAASVWGTLDVFVHVTAAPAFARTRGGLTP